MHSMHWARTAGLLVVGIVGAALVGPALAAPGPEDTDGWEVTDYRATSHRPTPRPTVPTVRFAPRATGRSPARKTALPSPNDVTPTASPNSTRHPAGLRPPAVTMPALTTTPTKTTTPALTTSPITSGWHSGAAGPGTLDGTLTALRGRPLQIVGVYADTTGPVQATLPVLTSLAGYPGDIDIAIGGLTDDTPETWARAATGTYLNRWTQAARALRAARGSTAGTVYVRFAHEINTDWFPWAVTSRTVADFRTSWRLFHDVLAREYPQARLVLCLNSGSRTDVSVEQLWPGDDVVDVVAVDVHTGWEPTDAAGWQQRLDDVATDGSPRGLLAWLAFAAKHHKPLAVSRWGLDPGSSTTDDGTRVRVMHDFLASHAAVPGQDPAGRILYDIFFNFPVGTDTRPQLTDPRNAVSARTYRSLVWGTP
jgi:hypothetical protein